MTPIRASFVFSKACDIFQSMKMQPLHDKNLKGDIRGFPLAVFTSSELLSCVQGADMSIPTCSSEKSPLA